MTKTLILIPAYNEEKRIEDVINELRKYSSADVLVVDDGSKDNTSKVCLRNNVSILKHFCNFGYGTALQTGFKYALEKGYDYIVQMDADGQHKAKHIPIILKEIKKNDYDVIIGSRFLKNSGYKIPLIRRLGMKLFSNITSIIINQKITDPTSGFRAINKKVARFYASDIYPTDFPDADVIIMLKFAGAKIKEIPVEMRGSSKKTSMHNGLKPIYYIFKMFFSIFLTVIRERNKL